MPSKTLRLSAKKMERNWQVLDAANRPLGRVASEAAQMLLGKHKPNYEPFLPMGDFVVIVNAAEIAVTGEKTKRKIYYRHTGYPGGIRERTLEEQMARDPRRVVERAVKDAREEGKTIVPQCWFVRQQIDRHPEWQDVL